MYEASTLSEPVTSDPAGMTIVALPALRLVAADA
jgi:hypothetical protein